MAGDSSMVSVIPRSPPGPQVFTSFRGKDVRKSFISFLVPALRDKNINVFIDDQEDRGKFLISLFDRISESKVALVIFSEGYTESKWCLDELVKIKECMDQKKLIAIPIFYKLDPSEVKCLRGKFGDQFRDLGHRYRHEPERLQKWTEALASVSQTFAMSLSKNSDKSDQDFISSIVTEVKKIISKGKYGETDNDFSVIGRKLTMPMCEASNEKAVEVPVLYNITGYIQIWNQSPGPLYEDLNRPNGNVLMINARDLGSKSNINSTTTVANTYFDQKRMVMVYARDLRIAWSDNSTYWVWLPLQNETTSNTLVEAAVLRQVCWLGVDGKFDTRVLTPEKMYEVVYVVRLEYTTSKWKSRVNLRLTLPNSRARAQERSVSLKKYIGKLWVDIPVGEFMTSPENAGEIHFSMYEKSGQWKSGLIVKGVAIRPKT